MSRIKQRSAFDQISEFDRGRIVAYRDCGLSFREIGSRVGRNQTTVMRICDCWMQDGTTNRRGRSHPPQCTTSRVDRQIVRMAMTDRSVTSQTVAQHIESVTHLSVSACTIGSRLQQSGLSARRPLLGLPLTQNHRHLRRQWCDERRMWPQNGMKLSSLTSYASVCNTTMVGFESGDTGGERMLNSCVMHHHIGPAPGITVWGGIGYHSRTPLVRIAGTLNSQHYISEVLEPVVLPYLQGLATTIFQQDDARPHVARIVQRFLVNHQIELFS
ncbi:transposable element Tcb1 transposase [Trichonephila clavipes]|nr:transposable element Tcb1 transposase [Trichonephila clavipes]